MLDKEVIRNSTSPWNAPVVLARKKDGTWRFCVDYRGLNQVTVRDMYPLPRIDDALDALSSAKYFTTLDAWTGYWQTSIQEEDRAKMAFSTQEGHYKFNVTPFGLVNAPGSFQRIMNMLLHGLTWHSCLVYLDDIIIFSKTFDEHLEKLGEVLDRLEKADVCIKMSKCTFCTDTVHYLGHIVSPDSVRPDPAKVTRLREIAPPVNPKEVHTFLGLAGYYRKFIENFAEATAPLNWLLESDTEFTWGEEQQLAFEDIINQLSQEPVLMYPDWAKEFLLAPDVCKYSIGSVLSQVKEEDQLEHLVAYYSRLMKCNEMWFGVTEQECLAMVESIRHFRPYLWGNRFTIITDHKALQWLYNAKDHNDRLYRWFLKLMQEGFDFNIMHRAGKDHGNADAISRLMCKWDRGEEEPSVMAISVEGMVEETSQPEGALAENPQPQPTPAPQLVVLALVTTPTTVDTPIKDAPTVREGGGADYCPLGTPATIPCTPPTPHHEGEEGGGGQLTPQA